MRRKHCIHCHNLTTPPDTKCPACQEHVHTRALPAIHDHVIILKPHPEANQSGPVIARPTLNGTPAAIVQITTATRAILISGSPWRYLGA